MEHYTPQDSAEHSIMSQPGQPGLEVGANPHANSHAGWNQDSKPVWGANSAEYPLYQHEIRSRRILGLTAGTFWGIVVLIIVLLAGGIGGGVGAGLASRKSKCSGSNPISNGTPPANAQTSSSASSLTTSSSATSRSQTVMASATSTTSSFSTSTSTTASVSPAPSTYCETEAAYDGSKIVPLDATGNPIPLGNTVQQTFKVFCNTNWPGGAALGNPGLHDIMKIYQPDLEQCVAACAEYNAAYTNNAAAGIAVGGGLCKAVALVLAPGEFCYLKNGTGVNDTSTSGGARIDSAMLQ